MDEAHFCFCSQFGQGFLGAEDLYFSDVFNLAETDKIENCVLQEPVKSASISLPCSCDATSFSSCKPALPKPLPKAVAESIPRRIL